MVEAMTAYLEHKDLTRRDISSKRADQIAENVRCCLDSLAQAADQAGRRPSDVQLLAATKTRDVGEIMAAVTAGITLIGENRPQEVALKGGAIRAESTSPLGFHLIGQLQSNKINKILPYVDTIESVDSASLARKISDRALAAGKTVRIFLEVNVSGEESKSGCQPQQVEQLADQIASLPALTLAGLMTVGPHVTDESAIRHAYSDLRQLRDGLLEENDPAWASCTDLSMGMSQDYPLAVAEGATIVRLGTAIFGPRAFV